MFKYLTYIQFSSWNTLFFLLFLQNTMFLNDCFCALPSKIFIYTCQILHIYSIFFMEYSFFLLFLQNTMFFKSLFLCSTMNYLYTCSISYIYIYQTIFNGILFFFFNLFFLITHNTHNRHIGMYDTPLEAAEVYDREAVIAGRPPSFLNFPDRVVKRNFRILFDFFC